jgi:hypothetical protein
MPYTYPTEFDKAGKILGLLGSHWERVYAGNGLLQSLIGARGQLEVQTHLNLLELVASVSRFTIPVFHIENWYFLTFKESEVNNFEALVETYTTPTDNTYTLPTELKYGVPLGRTTYSVPIPEELASVRVILNRVAAPSLTLIEGVDYWIEAPGILTFRENPFTNTLVPLQDIFDNGVVTDREAGLWIFRGEWDWQNVYEQFGYALQMYLQSSDGFKNLMNAVMDALVEGSKLTDLHHAWSAITGVPLCESNGEVVEDIADDLHRPIKLIITDKKVYKFPKTSTAIVEIGDTLVGGQPLVDTLMFYEFNRGQVPVELTALAMGRGFIGAGYLGDLTFENKTVPLNVEYDSDGYTKVSFELGGFVNDIEQFWNDVHARGRMSGTTLAMRLDVRANPVGQPGPASLPETVNPLQFLVENLLRYNAFVVKVKPHLMGSAKLGLHTANYLRKIVPPNVAMIVVAELQLGDEPIIMEGPGDETTPGYTESVSGFPCMITDDVITPSSVAERVRIKQLVGKCE